MQYIKEIVNGIADKTKRPFINICSDFAVIILIIVFKYIIVFITEMLFKIPPLLIQVVEALSSGIIITILIGLLIEVISDIYLENFQKLHNNQDNILFSKNEKVTNLS